MAERHLVVGLGNPGREYRQNRHNAGFLVLDRLVRRHALPLFTKRQGQALISTGAIQGVPVVLAKPQTYMNLSGQSVQGLLHFYKIPSENLMVAHDDLDLPLGTIRIRPGGGAGGQRGMASTIERLGTKDFPRLRLGIGRPPGRMAPADYVLQNFSRAEMLIVSETLDRAANAVLTFMTEGLNAAMNRFNGSVAA